MLRAIVLSLALLIGLGTIIPLATNFAEAGHKDLSLYEKKREPRIRKFSKNWWGAYNKRKLRAKKLAKVEKNLRIRRKKNSATAVSKKIVRRKRISRSKRLTKKRKSAWKGRTAKKKNVAAKRNYTAKKRVKTGKTHTRKPNAYESTRYAKNNSIFRNASYTQKRIVSTPKAERVARISVTENVFSKQIEPQPTPMFFAPVMLPNGGIAPQTWMTGEVTPGEIKFEVNNSNGFNIGSAAISVVGPTKEEQVKIFNPRITMIGGVMTTSLRRTVIDKMIEVGGWITNDYQKEVDGQKVYVVEAKSPGEKGQLNSRLFYFTEVDGQIYNVATNSNGKSIELLAEESEKVVGSLHKAEEVETAESIENSNAIAGNFTNVFINQ